MDSNSAVTRPFAYVGVVAPAVLTVVAVALQLVWLPSTPDPIAVHWSGSGPDGSGPGWTFPLITIVLGFGLSVWLWASALPRLRRGSRGWTFRFLAAFALGMSMFAAVSMTWSVAIQRGLDTWHDAPSVLPAVVAGAALGVGAGVVGYFVQPQQMAKFETLPAASVSVADGERVVWFGVARAGRAAVIGIAVAVLILAIETIVLWLAGQYAIMWILVAVTAVVAVSGLAMLEADVRVDGTGVSVRGAAGWPRSHVAIAEIASASAITVTAFGDFGGWGWRRTPGAMGVIMRSGGALRVERKEGHALVVTVDDAATAAALVNSLVARAHS